MRTKDLDKLLLELQRRVRPLPRAPYSAVDEVVGAAQKRKGALPKMAVFVTVLPLMDALEGATHINHVKDYLLAAQDAGRFCESVIFYYMLKGCGCESEIPQHQELDVITRLLT